jgi:hypothetical protein
MWEGQKRVATATEDETGMMASPTSLKCRAILQLLSQPHFDLCQICCKNLKINQLYTTHTLQLRHSSKCLGMNFPKPHVNSIFCVQYTV